MKLSNNKIYIYILSFIVLIILYYLWRPKAIENFSLSRYSNFNDSLASIMLISNILADPENANIPVSKKKVWVCNPETGVSVPGFTIGIDCNEKDSVCQTLSDSKKLCRYKQMPSTLVTSDNSNDSTSIENEVDQTNLVDVNVFIPPTVNTCKKGCTHKSLQTSGNYYNFLDSQTMWKCSPDTYLYKNYGYTDVYDSPDVCKTDTDCIWCNETGILPVNINTEAYNESSSVNLIQ